MKIDVRNGDVQVRDVRCWEHSRGVFTFYIFTPFDPFVAVIFGKEADRAGYRTLFDLYAPRRDEPSRITVVPESTLERAGLNGVMVETRSERNHATIQAIPHCLYDQRGGLIARWTLPSAKVDYLERLY